jgi:hypothetical protein
MKKHMGIIPLKSCLFGTVFLVILSCNSSIAADEWKAVLDLRGKWKFELGDGQNRADVAFDDSKWEEIFVPSAWEDEGYPGYDGYAWYRKHFRLTLGADTKILYLRLGCIDDDSEIYLNGKLIGVYGSFPPDWLSAYNTEIILPIPKNLLKSSGDNVIAIRVYDDQLGGGIVQGKIGLFESKTYINPELYFSGQWSFKKGDSEKWADPSLDDRSWNKIFAPAYWETQGYSEYNGMGWYRLHFNVPGELNGKSLVLLLGKIDDLDETYINGTEIGRTGRIRSDPSRSSLDGEYREFRAYTIPSGLLKSGQDNVLAVRVYDGTGGGGIYEGPIGIISRENFKEWKKNNPWNNKSDWNLWKILEEIFD